MAEGTPLSNHKACVLFERLGPYHHARLAAAGKILGVAAIETCGMDDVYQWRKVDGAVGFERVTLFPRQERGRRWNRLVRQAARRALQQLRPHCIVVPGWSFPNALAAICWAVQNGVPLVLMSESQASDELRSWHKEYVKRQLVKSFSAAVVGGKPHADYLIQLGLSPGCLFFGYDAVDNRYFTDSRHRYPSAGLKELLGDGLKRNYLLSSGRFVEKKNFLRLISAYARYRALILSGLSSESPASLLPWALVLLGDGPLRDALSSEIKRQNVQGHVFMPGFKQYEELPTFYGSSHCFVHPSTTEQWGLVVNEAMASGLPVLVSNRCGCAPDLVQEGVNGFTFDPYDVEGMARLMLKMTLMEHSRREEMGRKSQEIIADWGPERFAQGLRSAVDIALNNPLPRVPVSTRALLHMLLWR